MTIFQVTDLLAQEGPINTESLQRTVLALAGVALGLVGLVLLFKGLTRHFAEALTGLVAVIIGLAIIGVGAFSQDALRNLATGLANMLFSG